MKKKITDFVANYIQKADKEGIIPLIWREPLVRFGDAALPELVRLKELVHPEHGIPEDVLPCAQTIIAYFLPFRQEVGDTNRGGRLSSKEWAMAYEKTNAVIGELNEALVSFLGEHGVRAAVSPDAGSYDNVLLKSKWSQRHLAYYCGLGTFGKNNMLITEKGCCGRISTVVTDMVTEHDRPVEGEYCLYKKDGSCGKCIRRCPVQALTANGYEAKLCNGFCDENAAVHVGYCEKPSYQLENTDNQLIGSNVCGKCVTGMPCTYQIPGGKNNESDC
ncbi:MAG: epoxyqueuosine reductase [Clostridia bacterium]